MVGAPGNFCFFRKNVPPFGGFSERLSVEVLVVVGRGCTSVCAFSQAFLIDVHNVQTSKVIFVYRELSKQRVRKNR